MATELNDRRVRYIASAAQTAFDVDFDIEVDTDVEAIQKIDATGAINTLVITTDYTIVLDGVAPNTAVLTLVVGAAVGDIITLQGQTPVDREEDFSTGGDYRANVVNNAEDRQYRIMQERKRDQDRTVVANPVSPDAFDPILPDTVGNGSKFLSLASDGLSWVFSTLVNIGTVVISSSNPQDTGTAAPGNSGEVSDADHVHAIPTNGIVTLMITALNVTTGKIAALAVTTAKIAANAVDNTKLKAALIGDFTEVVVTASDSFLLADASDSGNSKRDTIQGLLDLLSGLAAPDFTSSEQTVAVDTVLDVAHSLGAVPTLTHVIFRCKTAEHGFAIGDEIFASDITTSADRTYTLASDATNVTIVQGALIAFLSQSTLNTATFTPANWKWIVRAWS